MVEVKVQEVHRHYQQELKQIRRATIELKNKYSCLLADSASKVKDLEQRLSRQSGVKGQENSKPFVKSSVHLSQTQHLQAVEIGNYFSHH